MLAPIACRKRAWWSFGRLSGSQPSAWFWAWSRDPLKFMRRHPPHHLSPARANHPAGQDPEARLSRPSHHSNAPISPVLAVLGIASTFAGTDPAEYHEQLGKPFASI